MEAIRRVLLSSEQQVAVVKAKVDVLRDMGVSESVLMKIHEQVEVEEQGNDEKIELISIEALAELPAEDASIEVLHGLADLIGQVMRIDIRSEYSDDKEFEQIRLTSLGIDSLTTMDLRNRVRAWLGVDIPSDLLIGGGRIIDVVVMVNQKLMLKRLSRIPDIDKTKNNDTEAFVL
jgi:acyl carrier protein